MTEDAPPTLTLTRTRKPLPAWSMPLVRLYARTTPFGTHLSGVLGSTRVQVFLTHKDGPDDADAVVTLSPRTDGRPPRSHGPD